MKIHIPEMLDLLGTGRIRQALELIESCNPLPNVTGRVCPQELQCQGVCTHTGRPIEIGQLEWYLPQRDKLQHAGVRRCAPDGFVDPWVAADKPPIAVVGSGPAGLINAYLLAAEGYPGHRVRGVPRARRRAALRHSRVPPAQRADRRRGGKIRARRHAS